MSSKSVVTPQELIEKNRKENDQQIASIVDRIEKELERNFSSGTPVNVSVGMKNKQYELIANEVKKIFEKSGWIMNWSMCRDPRDNDLTVTFTII